MATTAKATTSTSARRRVPKAQPGDPRAMAGALPERDPPHDADEQRRTGDRQHEEDGDQLVQRAVAAGGQQAGDEQRDADVGDVGDQPGEGDRAGTADGGPGVGDHRQVSGGGSRGRGAVAMASVTSRLRLGVPRHRHLALSQTGLSPTGLGPGSQRGQRRRSSPASLAPDDADAEAVERVASRLACGRRRSSRWRSAICSALTSASTMRSTRSWKPTSGLQPSTSRALLGSPTSRSTSAGRKKRGSWVTYLLQSAMPTRAKATSSSSRMLCVLPVATT